MRGLGAVCALALIAAGTFYFTRGPEVPEPTVSVTTLAQGSPSSGTAEPGTQTGVVDPSPLAAETACGDNPPASASLPKPQYNEPAQVVEENQRYFARIETSCGTIVVKLLPEQAPETVNSFVFLAQQAYFDGQIFHRIDPGLTVLQGGDPTGTGSGGPGYVIPDELTGQETYPVGTLAMANAGPDTGGSQFFLVGGDGSLGLPPNYTVFGQIVEGLDVLQRILALEITDPNAGITGQRPLQAIYIDALTISND